MESLFIDYNKILNKNSREYFREVVSSYDNSNYRAAVVMLYSVSVCDVLYKLKDLSELYGDAKAERLLRKYEGHRSGDDKSSSKSRWEYELLSDAKDAGLIDSVLFREMETVYSYRNLSAHPILDQNFELCSPTKELTIALILDIYNRLLSQPPLYISRIIDSLSEDLAKRKSILLADSKLLSSSIMDKYLSHLNEKYIIQVFKAFWKFCFILENDECNENRIINLEVMRLILNTNKEIIISAIRNDSIHYCCALNDDCISSLVILVSEYPGLYKVLREEEKTTIISFISREIKFRTISWFLYDSIGSFIEDLKQNQICTVEDYFITRIVEFFEHNGNINLLYDYFLFCYALSFSFDSAKVRWAKLISPILERLSKTQLAQLVEITNNNSQIYNSFHSSYANNRIVKALHSLGPLDIDLSEYRHFSYDRTILEDSSEV